MNREIPGCGSGVYRLSWRNACNYRRSSGDWCTKARLNPDLDTRTIPGEIPCRNSSVRREQLMSLLTQRRGGAARASEQLSYSPTGPSLSFEDRRPFMFFSSLLFPPLFLLDAIFTASVYEPPLSSPLYLPVWEAAKPRPPPKMKANDWLRQFSSQPQRSVFAKPRPFVNVLNYSSRQSQQNCSLFSNNGIRWHNR